MPKMLKKQHKGTCNEKTYGYNLLMISLNMPSYTKQISIRCRA